jgi:hypothetical protein
LAALVMALIAVGCDDGHDQPTNEDYDDLAAAFAPLVANDLSSRGSMSVAAAMARGAAPAWLSFDASGRARGGLGELSWSVDIQCEDAGGLALAVCDATTDTARAEAAVAGSLNIPFVSASLDASGSWLLEGIQSQRVRAKGAADIDASTQLTSPFRPAQRALQLTASCDYDVVFSLDEPELARGGGSARVEAHHTWTAPEGNSDANFLVDVEVSLDGSGGASLVIDGDAHYELNLQNGTVVRIDL